jgi:integrase
MASVFKRGRWVDSNGRKCAKDAPGAKWMESKLYMIQILIDGKPKLVKGYTDKGATEQLAAKLERQKAKGEQGLIDPYKVHRTRALAAHVADYVADLRALGRDDKYTYNVEKRLAKLLNLCGWKVLGHITADAFAEWREKPIKRKEAEDGAIGPRTINQYHEAVRAFCKWCVKRNRLATNPLAGMEQLDETADVRRARRALTAEQLAALLAVIAEPHNTLYRFILSTGLRRQEAMDLKWGDVRLNAPLPFLALRAAATKARRADELPLRADLAELLKSLRADEGDDQRVFPKMPTMDQHRAYLKAAGIDWKDCDGRRADFHALRHTYGTLLSKAGVMPREAMALMRHTDMKQTMRTYTDARVFNLAGAVEKLPMPMPAAMVATGTDSTSIGASNDKSQPAGRSESVSSPSARIGYCSASISKDRSTMQSSLSLVDGTDRQQKTPSGGDGVETRQVGLEPTTFPLTAGCSTIELLSNGCPPLVRRGQGI